MTPSVVECPGNEPSRGTSASAHRGVVVQTFVGFPNFARRETNLIDPYGASGAFRSTELAPSDALATKPDHAKVALTSPNTAGTRHTTAVCHNLAEFLPPRVLRFPATRATQT